VRQAGKLLPVWHSESLSKKRHQSAQLVFDGFHKIYRIEASRRPPRTL
jgi:hypothetical protein